MQFLPAAPELLGAIATLLDEKVLKVVPADLQHQVRVAGHLAALLEREARLGPAAVRRERELIGALLGVDADEPAAALDQRLRAGVDDDLAARTWAALVEITRHDLAICKPGHDGWEGV
jgi:Domain of unknown function (DUF6285)